MEVLDFTQMKKATPGIMVRMSKSEAIRLIKSLSSQIAADNPNVGREESRATLNRGKNKREIYFSVSVNDQLVK